MGKTVLSPRPRRRLCVKTSVRAPPQACAVGQELTPITSCTRRDSAETRAAHSTDALRAHWVRHTALHIMAALADRLCAHRDSAETRAAHGAHTHRMHIRDRTMLYPMWHNRPKTQSRVQWVDKILHHLVETSHGTPSPPSLILTGHGLHEAVGSKSGNPAPRGVRRHQGT